MYCREECHRHHSYGLDGRSRDHENSCNTYPQQNLKPNVRDEFAPKVFGFFDHEGKCYRTDELTQYCGGFRSDPIRPPLFDHSPSVTQDRAYSGSTSRDDFQMVYRSCSRGIPYEMCPQIEGPITDDSGIVHTNDIRPLFMVDSFGRRIKLEFVNLAKGNLSFSHFDY